MERLDLRLSKVAAELSFMYEALGYGCKSLLNNKDLENFVKLSEKFLTVTYNLAGDHDPKWGINTNKSTINSN